MNKIFLIKTIVLIAVLAVISSCSNSELDEAKKLGFESVAEMKSLHAKGWHTKARYEQDMAMQQGYASAAEMKEAIENRKAFELAQAEAEQKRAEEEKNRPLRINDLLLALKYGIDPFLIRAKLNGKKIETSIFPDKREDLGSKARVYGDSGVYCEIDGADYHYISKREPYVVVVGTLHADEVGLGLKDCKYVKTDPTWEADDLDAILAKLK